MRIFGNWLTAEGYRRHQHCHAEPLALPGRHLGLQAGKDVYVEKPVSHNVWEGRQFVKAARKYNRIVQAGTQSAPVAESRKPLLWLTGWQHGKDNPCLAALCYKRRASIGKVDGPQQSPARSTTIFGAVPAPKGPLMRSNCITIGIGYGQPVTGTLATRVFTKWISRAGFWASRSLSPKVFSLGGRLGYVDDGTPRIRKSSFPRLSSRSLDFRSARSPGEFHE